MKFNECGEGIGQYILSDILFWRGWYYQLYQ